MTPCTHPDNKYWLCPYSLPSTLQHGAYLGDHGCKFSKEDYFTGELSCVVGECKHTGEELKSDLNIEISNERIK